MPSIGSNGNVTAAGATSVASCSKPAAIGGTIIRGISNTNAVFAINPRHPDTASLRTYLSYLKHALSNKEDPSLHQHVRNDERKLIDMDVKFLSLLVEMANNEQPERHIYLAGNPALFGNMLIQLVNEGVKSAIFVVNCTEDATHFAVFSYSLKNDRVSVIGIEPALLVYLDAGRLARAVDSFLREQLPGVAFTMIESDLQRSNAECAMYSLALAKKMHKEQAHFAELHDRNRQGELYSLRGENIGSFSFIPGDEADRYLPVSMLKHAQSPKRPQAYLQQNPDAADKPVNKRNENLSDRQQRYLATVAKRDKTITFSTSIFHKRQTEIERAIRWKESNKSISDTQGNIPAEEKAAIRHYDVSQALKELTKKRRQLESIEQQITVSVAGGRINKNNMQAFLTSVAHLPAEKHIRLGLGADGRLKRIQGLMGWLRSWFSPTTREEINKFKADFRSSTNKVTVEFMREKCRIFIENQQKKKLALEKQKTVLVQISELKIIEKKLKDYNGDGADLPDIEGYLDTVLAKSADMPPE